MPFLKVFYLNFCSSIQSAWQTKPSSRPHKATEQKFVTILENV